MDLEDDDDVYDGDMVAMNVNRQGQNQAYIKQYADKKKQREAPLRRRSQDVEDAKNVTPQKRGASNARQAEPQKMVAKKMYDDSIFMELRIKLPYQDTESDKKARIVQWRQLDMNGNGYLSLAELDKGMRDVI